MFKIGSTIICKKYYFYDGHYFIGDKFTIVENNKHNIKIKTKLNTYHLIGIDKKESYWFYYNDIFYTLDEMRKLKIKKIIR